MAQLIDLFTDAEINFLFGDPTPRVVFDPAETRVICSPNEVTDSISAMHKHQCPECGTTWKHPDAMVYCADARQFDEGHTCPHCGTPEVTMKFMIPGDEQ